MLGWGHFIHLEHLGEHRHTLGDAGIRRAEVTHVDYICALQLVQVFSDAVVAPAPLDYSEIQRVVRQQRLIGVDLGRRHVERSLIHDIVHPREIKVRESDVWPRRIRHGKLHHCT